MIEPRLRREVASAYLATAMRSAAWIGVTAMLIRTAGRPAYATLTLLSTTIALLEYTALGLGPAMIRVTAQRLAATRAANPPDENSAATAAREVYASGLAMALLSAAAGAILLLISILLLHNHGPIVLQLCALLGIATLLRTTSDALGATLQTQRKIHRDNLLIALGETLWLLFTAAALARHIPWQFATGGSLVLAAALLLLFRTTVAARLPGHFYRGWTTTIRTDVVWQLLVVGFMLTAAQMADFLYSPTDNLIIANCINRDTVADYNPAVQVDSGLLLLATALASVLLPRSALAHAAGDTHAVRRYYIRGTLFCAAVLLAAAPITLYFAPWAFHLWQNRDMSVTLHILPIMLIHTILGGSSAVGRAVLIAIGRIRPLVLSVLIAGIANVILSYALVRFAHLGLMGIVLGTIIAVTARCAVWMPWYTLRALRTAENSIL